MKRILFFGDSFTYGYGLPDCHADDTNLERIWPTLKPSKMGWARIAADIVGAECINLSIRGASNMEIHWAIRNHEEYKKGDVIVVQWSFDDRDLLLSDPPKQIGPWTSDDETRHYYLAHDEIDVHRRNVLIVEHTALWLTNHGFKWMFFANRPFTYRSHVDDIIKDYSKNYNRDVAEDGMHPGVETNKAWGEAASGYLSELINGDTKTKVEIPLTTKD